MFRLREDVSHPCRTFVKNRRFCVCNLPRARQGGPLSFLKQSDAIFFACEIIHIVLTSLNAFRAVLATNLNRNSKIATCLSRAPHLLVALPREQVVLSARTTPARFCSPTSSRSIFFSLHGGTQSCPMLCLVSMLSSASMRLRDNVSPHSTARILCEPPPSFPRSTQAGEVVYVLPTRELRGA